MIYKLYKDSLILQVEKLMNTTAGKEITDPASDYQPIIEAKQFKHFLNDSDKVSDFMKTLEHKTGKQIGFAYRNFIGYSGGNSSGYQYIYRDIANDENIFVGRLFLDIEHDGGYWLEYSLSKKEMEYVDEIRKIISPVYK